MARPQDTALARFYGLPKVHKDGAPLRPIVSLKGTPTYGLAKWLFRRLKFLTAESDTTVSSAAQFLEKLKGISIHPNEVMVSFDVTSLFTSIPQDLAIETIELLPQSKYDETENRLGHAQILQLLKLCLRTYFTFDRTIYEQVKSTPMGSPISGFIAEAVLQRLESLVFQYHRPKFWARYVDDTFVVIERDQVLTFQEHLNAVFPDIQFTMEEEENNQLAFLDVLGCRKDCGGLKTKVVGKATNKMQVLNFNSNHPISHKRSCVRTLYRRVETHCSVPEDKTAELQYLRRVFKANGYPRNFVDRCIRKRDERPNRRDTKSWRPLPLMFSAMLMDSYRDESPGIRSAYRADGQLNRRRTRASERLSTPTFNDLLFANDSALNTEREADVQQNMDLLRTDHRHVQNGGRAPTSTYTAYSVPRIHANCTELETNSVWNRHGLHLNAKLKMYDTSIRSGDLDRLLQPCQEAEPLPTQLSPQAAKAEVAGQDHEQGSPGMARILSIQAMLSPTTLTSASPVALTPNFTASTTTTALTTDVQHPCGPPPAVTLIFIIPITTSAAATVTITALTLIAEQSTAGSLPKITFTITTPSPAMWTGSSLHVHPTRQTGRLSPLPPPASENPRGNRTKRRTALVAQELARYKVDITALTETRFSKQGRLEEHRTHRGERPAQSLRHLPHRQQQSSLLSWSPPCATEAAGDAARLTARKAEEIQGYAARKEWKNFFALIKAVCGPPTKAIAPPLSANGTTPLNERTPILQRWAQQFRGVLNHPSDITDAAIACLPQVETNVDLDLLPSLHETIRPYNNLKKETRSPGQELY
nr:unnamed protein product [Spirometra erinaceieuropaei]